MTSSFKHCFFCCFVQAEEQLRLFEEQRLLLEERQKLEDERRKKTDQEQKLILGKHGVRPKLSFSFK
jgi:hypothetical protein